MLSLALISLVDHAGGMAYVCRLLFGFAAGALFPGYFALAADIVPEGRRTEGLAIFGLGGLIPLAFNPMVERLGIEPGQLALFFPMVGAFILLSLAMLIPVREPERPKPDKKRSVMEVLGRLFVRPLWPVWFAAIVFSALVSVFMTFATVCAQSRMIDDPADLWLTYAAGAAMVRIFGAKLPDRVGTRNMIAPSVGFYVVGLIVTAQAQSAEAFLWGGFLTGLGHGYCFPVLTSQVVDRVDKTLTGSGMAVFTALWEIVSLVITPLFGILADRSGDGIMFFTAAIIATGALFLWALAERRWGPKRMAPT
jgi:MFS family permease